MSRLIMWNLVTLDGYFEGPSHDISWFGDVWGEELEAVSVEQLETAGALLFGRTTYAMMAVHWPTETGVVADFMNGLAKFVFSRSQRQGEWNNTHFLPGDVVGEVTRLKRETAGDILLFGSADLAGHLLAARLFDEIRLCVTPHLLGSGRRLFGDTPERQKLELIDARALAIGGVILRYRPGK